jgi:hypothetical protein
MFLILLIIVAILLIGGTGYFGGSGYGPLRGWRPPGYGGRLILFVLVLVLLIWAVNEITMPPLPMPAGTPPISR